MVSVYAGITDSYPGWAASGSDGSRRWRYGELAGSADECADAEIKSSAAGGMCYGRRPAFVSTHSIE